MLLLYSGYLYMSVFYVFSYFFFFKQKTAYEMLISDWSSDVCSSDLGQFAILGDDRWAGRPHGVYKMLSSGGERSRDDDDRVYAKGAHLHADYFGQDVPGGRRSEEHTSELKSLMRISYAVFCFKKKILRAHICTTVPYSHSIQLLLHLI